MNGWVKLFSDNTKYTGSDIAVSKGLASWQNSRSFGMIGVSLVHNNYLMKIMGFGNYWQSDKYEIALASDKPKLISRRIMKEIINSDMNICLYQDNHNFIVGFNSMLNYKPRPIPLGWKGKWLVLQLHIPTLHISHLITEGPI